MATTNTPTYSGTKGTYTVHVGGTQVGTVTRTPTSHGTHWVATPTPRGPLVPRSHYGNTRKSAVAAMRAAHPATCTCGYCPFVPGKALAAYLARTTR